MASTTARTFLAFQHNAKLHVHKTAVTAVRPFSALEEANRLLFKDGTEDDHVVVTRETIFHPQGGGQPSDVGTMTGPEPSDPVFNVATVRMDAVRDGQVLHFGRFASSGSGSGSSIGPAPGSDSNSAPPAAADTNRPPVPPFPDGTTITQRIDSEKRALYSRLHTAGHVLGSAVRHLLEKEVDGFDELKASHFPGQAACEFRGAIEGRWKGPIQEKVDEYVAAGAPVEVDFWDEGDFRRNGLERLIPEPGLAAPGDKFRVVRIAGCEVYPCGGTHVDSTDLCGRTAVKKISRSKGVSRVSYTVAEGGGV